MVRAAHHLLPNHSLPVLSVLIKKSSFFTSPFSYYYYYSYPPPLLSRSICCRKLLLRSLSSPPPHFHSLSPFFPMHSLHLSSTASFSGNGSTGDGREILVQHLLVKEDDSELLSELQKRIIRGEDMSDLAVDYSICPSKEEGGMLGWVRRGQMVPEFEEAAFSAPINKVVKCKTKFGWHLLQVISEREESVLEDIQPHQLHEKLQDPCFMEEAQLIDVREPYEVDQASLPGFQVLPLRQFGNWGPEITTNFDPEKDTYVLCHHGVRSLQVAQWLQTQGFKKVFNVSGGIHAYALKVDPSISTY